MWRGSTVPGVAVPAPPWTVVVVMKRPGGGGPSPQEMEALKVSEYEPSLKPGSLKVVTGRTSCEPWAAVWFETVESVGATSVIVAAKFWQEDPLLWSTMQTVAV